MVLSVLSKASDNMLMLLSEEVWLSYRQRGIISDVSLCLNLSFAAYILMMC